MTRHPELLDAPMEKPLFLFGLPRTGTTLAINLLTSDPARRGCLRWEAFDSVPPPGPEELHAGPRYQVARDKIDISMKYAPQISAIHHEDGDSPTECQFSMAPSFLAQVYEAMAHIPSCRNWFLHEADYLPAFRYQKRLFQLLQANTGGRWTLKNPWHPLYLDALTAVYPDAQLVMTHRDPTEVVGSACSFIHTVRTLTAEKVDPIQIGKDQIALFDLIIERTNKFHAKHGPDVIHHVQYVDVMKDPIDTVRGIYERFDEPFTPAASDAMQTYMANNQKGKHCKHEYRLETYGFTRVEILDRCADYIKRYNIPVKSQDF